MSTSSILLFSATFLFISITPGICMTLALTLGMTVGPARARWMMVGELIGVSTVVIVCGFGISTIVLQHPKIFTLGKYLGGAYLIYLAIQLWQSKGKMAVNELQLSSLTLKKRTLILQGLITALSNPKGWAFFVALIPAFLDHSAALLPQIIIMLIIVNIIEFISMNVYAYGGKALRLTVEKRSNVQILNRIASVLIGLVSAWLVLGS